VLNLLAAVNHYRSYLEIGVRDPRANFDLVRVRHKYGVDPKPEGRVAFKMSSDAFFTQFEATNGVTAPTFDLIFIDGSHLAEQVERDVKHSLRHLAPDGAIVLHDCNPQRDDAQTLDYDGLRVWNGTVWKAWTKLRATRPDLTMFVVETDYGCGIITPGQQNCYPLSFSSYEELHYETLEADRQRLLNLITPQEFVTAYTSPNRARSLCS
jgi:hypothetical protein